MTQNPVYVVDDFKAVVAALNNVIPNVQFMHGHPLEIVNRLQKQVENPSKKEKRFPLIALFQDFREPRGRETHFYTEVSLNLIICTSTKPDYDSEQRYEKSFRTVLYPIYYELLNQLALSDRFFPSVVDQIEHDKWDRLYWGKQGLYGNSGNIFTDHIDAMEIENLKLQVQKSHCKPIH